MASAEGPRIVAVLQGFDLGGSVPSVCSQQLDALSSRYACSLITDRSSLPAPAPCSVERLAVPELRWLRRYAHVPRQLLFALVAAAHLWLHHRRHPPALVIVHSHPLAALLAPVLKRLLGCRLLMVMHGDINDRPSGTYDPRLTWWYRVNTSPAYRRSDAILALSPYMARLAVAGGAHPERIHLVPNAVDPADIGLDGDLLEDAADPYHLLFIGRWEANKGIDLLLAAFIQLAPQLPQLTLTCIGCPDPRTGLAALQRPLEAAGLAERVSWLPQLPRQQLGNHYRHAGLVVVPSRSETQSTVIMEAMAAARAVLASDTGGNPMLVDSGTTGLLFRNGDPADLASRLEELLASPDRVQAMGLAGQRRQRDLFSRQVWQQALLRSVDQMLASRVSSEITP